MKQIFFVILLFCASVVSTATSTAQQPRQPVYEEKAVNKNGVVFVRIVNTTPYAISCWLRDQYNFTAFVVVDNNTSLWYPVYGQYAWYCE